jgi:von Hippel-Lindau disease tumor supressor
MGMVPMTSRPIRSIAAALVALPLLTASALAEANRCAGEDSLRSIEGKAATVVTFINETDGPVRIYWLDYSGNRKRYAEVPAGEKHRQKTFVTHPWVVTDAQDNCLQIVQPAAQETTAAISSTSNAGADPVK